MNSETSELSEITQGSGYFLFREIYRYEPLPLASVGTVKYIGIKR